MKNFLYYSNDNKNLALKIASYVDIELIDIDIKKFNDNEISVDLEYIDNDIFIIHSISPKVNDNLIALLIIINKIRIRSNKKIYVIIPYLAYGRNENIGFICDLIIKSGANQITTIDVHNPNIINKDYLINLYPDSQIIDDIKYNYHDRSIVIIAPDHGAIYRSNIIAKRLSIPLIKIDKKNYKIIDKDYDIYNHDCIIIDDIIDSANTITDTSKLLFSFGAKSVISYVTHPVLSYDDYESLSKSGINELIITDSINKLENIKYISNIRIISIAELIAEAIGKKLEK